MRSASSQPSAERATYSIIALTTHARENWQCYLHILTKRLVSTTAGVHLKNGVKVSGTSLSGLAHHHSGVLTLLLATIRLEQDSGLQKNTHRKQTSSITEEDHSSYLGTTITEHSQKFSWRARTTVECTFLRILIKSIRMPLRCSHLPFGSI